jgi:ferric enterobactin receptor
MKYLFITIFELVCLFNGFSQNVIKPKLSGTLSGTIQDAKNGKPLTGASVFLYSKSNTQNNKTITSDKNGEFIFEKIPFDYYQINIKAIGFSSFSIDSILLRAEKDEIYFSEIQLKDSSAMLREVIVYSEKKLIEEKDGILTYNVTESPLSNGASTAEMLKNMPLVNANPDGSITVKGKAPLILIDEKPSNLNAQQLAELLESLPANMVEKVELMQTPPAEYATYDGTVINIVTKKGRVGYYQKFWLSAGTNGQKTGGTYLSYKSKKVTFNGHFNITNYNVIGNSRSTRQNLYIDSINYLYTKSDYDNKTKSPTIRLESNIDINKQKNIELVYQGIWSNIDNVTNANYTNLNNKLEVWKASKRTVNYDGNTYNHGFSGTYNWKDAKQKSEKFNIYTGLNLGKGVNDKTFYQQYLLNDLTPSGQDSTQNQFVDNYTTSYYIRTNYSKPLNKKEKTILNTGVNFTNDEDHTILNASYFNKATNTVNYNDVLSSNFIFNQTIATSRIGITFILSKGWRISFGEQAEYTLTSFHFLRGTTQNTSNDYWRFLPNITFRKEFSTKLNSTFTYRETIRRPTIIELNPNIDYTDAYNVRFGNPLIKPTLTQNFEYNLGYNTNNLNINSSFGYNKVKEVFTTVRTLVATGKTQTTYQNISDQEEYHINLWSGITITRKLKVNISSGVHYNKYSPIEKLMYKYMDGGSYYTGLNYSFMPNSLTTIEASNKYNSYATPQGISRSNISMYFSIQRKLMNKKFNVTFGASDPFGLTKYKGHTEGTNFIIDSYSINNIRNFKLTVSYQFNKTYIQKLTPGKS